MSESLATSESALDLPLEMYTEERQAEFLLSNAVDEADYARAVEAVLELGLDPETVTHQKLV